MSAKITDEQWIALGYWPRTARGWWFWMRYWSPPALWWLRQQERRRARR